MLLTWTNRLSAGLEISWTARLEGGDQWHGGWLAVWNKQSLPEVNTGADIEWLFQQPWWLNPHTVNFQTTLNLTLRGTEFQSRRMLRNLGTRKPPQKKNQQEVLHLGQDSPSHQHSLWTKWLRGSSAENNLGTVVDTMLNNSIKQASYWATWGKGWQTDGGKLLFLSLLSTSRASLSIYCVQSRDSQFKRDTAKQKRNQQNADQHDQVARLQVIQGQVRKSGLFSLGK